MKKSSVSTSIFFFFFSLLFGCSSDDSQSYIVLNGPTMGTTYTVKYDSADTGIDQKEEIAAGVDEILSEVNQQMSTYLKDSEISRFNRFFERDWFSVSDWFAEVTEAALGIWKESNGAFDVTVSPLVNTWGFGPEKNVVLPPSVEAIQEALSVVGSQFLKVRRSPAGLKKEKRALTCDLSAIAKGFGVDAISRYLESMGISNYFVEIGGEIRGRGRNSSGALWRVGIETPDETRKLRRIIVLEDKALATSGDYRNYFEKDGIRYSHTIDPRTGRPIIHTLASISVIDESCMRADGLATAINVMGPEKGYEFAVQKGLPIYMLVRENQTFREQMTPSFRKLLHEEAEQQPSSRLVVFLHVFFAALLLFLFFGFVVYWAIRKKPGCSCKMAPNNESCTICEKQEKSEEEN